MRGCAGKSTGCNFNTQQGSQEVQNRSLNEGKRFERGGVMSKGGQRIAAGARGQTNNKEHHRGDRHHLDHTSAAERQTRKSNAALQSKANITCFPPKPSLLSCLLLLDHPPCAAILRKESSVSAPFKPSQININNRLLHTLSLSLPLPTH